MANDAVARALMTGSPADDPVAKALVGSMYPLPTYHPSSEQIDPAALQVVQNGMQPKWQRALGQFGSSLFDAVTAPGNALMGNYNQVEIGPDGSVSPFDPRMVNDAANLAGLVTLGAGAAPAEANALGMGFRSRNADGLYHRYTPTANPDNGAGLMMFADDPYTATNYGSYHHTYNGTGIVDASKVANAAKKAGFEKELGYGVDQIDPSDIVDTAGAWDDPDAVQWLWDKVLEPKGWNAVSTQNGAVVFDPSLVKFAGRRDD